MTRDLLILFILLAGCNKNDISWEAKTYVQALFNDDNAVKVMNIHRCADPDVAVGRVSYPISSGEENDFFVYSRDRQIVFQKTDEIAFLKATVTCPRDIFTKYKSQNKSQLKPKYSDEDLQNIMESMPQ